MCLNVIKMMILVLLLCFGVALPSVGTASRPSIAWSWPGHENAVNPKEKLALPRKIGANLDGNIESKAIFTTGSFTTFPLVQKTRNSAIQPGLSGSCVCVPFHYCEESQVVMAPNTEGNFIIDVRRGWPCRSVMEVCCRKPFGNLITSPSAVPIIPTLTPPSEETSSSTVGTAIPGYQPTCGALNPNGVHARVLGFKDSEAQFGEYPFQAAILEQRQISGHWVLKFICGAALIWPSVVVTSAHCVNGRRAEHLIIRLGEWDTQSTSELLPHQDIWGKEVVLHPLYSSGALVNDIALVFLQESAVLSPHIDTVCLPSSSPQVSYDGTSCWATGWGRNEFGPGGRYQAVLHEIELSIVPEQVCLNLLRNTSLGPRFNFHPSYLCAGGLKGKDTCVGDGGGPLVCPSLTDPWRYVLAGLTSWGVGCGTYGVPGVYVDVSDFTPWIEAQVSLRVPTFDPRKIDVDTATVTTRDGNTATPRPPQYI